MQYFLDHIASILVVSIVLLIMVLVQIRGTQSAAESTVNNMVFGDVINMYTYLHRDLENMLTDTQALDAQSDGSYANSSGATICIGDDTTTTGIHSTQHTRTFRFPTLEDPEDPSNNNVVEVEYDLVNTGNMITLPTQDSTQTIPLFRLVRRVDGLYSGSSNNFVTAFRVETLNQFDDYNAFSPINGTCAANLRKVRFEFKMAQNGVAMEAGKTSTSQTNISRFGTTVHLNNWSL